MTDYTIQTLEIADKINAKCTTLSLNQEEVKEVLKAIEERKKGTWLNDWEMGVSECSICKETFLWEDHKGTAEWKYCPICGARMEET